MNLSPEALLIAVALALYLLDATLLLQPGEYALVQRARAGWAAHFGAMHWRLGGREPWLPNPLLPTREIYRGTWRIEDALPATEPPGAPSLQPRLPWAPRLCACAMLVLIFAVLPASLFMQHNPLVVGMVALAIYLLSLCAAWCVWRCRKAMGLSTRSAWETAIECIVCPPLAINLVRKLCLRSTLRPALSAVAPGLDAEAQQALRMALLPRLQEQIEIEPPGTERSRRLQGALHALKAEEPAPNGP